MKQKESTEKNMTEKDKKRFLDAYFAWREKNKEATIEMIWDGDNSHLVAKYTAPETKDPRILHEWMKKVEKVRGSITMTKDGMPHSAEDISLLDETLGYFLYIKDELSFLEMKR